MHPLLLDVPEPGLLDQGDPQVATRDPHPEVTPGVTRLPEVEVLLQPLEVVLTLPGRPRHEAEVHRVEGVLGGRPEVDPLLRGTRGLNTNHNKATTSSNPRLSIRNRRNLKPI